MALRAERAALHVARRADEDREGRGQGTQGKGPHGSAANPNPNLNPNPNPNANPNPNPNQAAPPSEDKLVTGAVSGAPLGLPYEGAGLAEEASRAAAQMRQVSSK